METIIRKGITFDKNELIKFDVFAKKKGFKNRSEAIRNIIRKSLVEEQTEDENSFMMASLTMIYNYHSHEVQHNLTHKQHHHTDLVRSTLHVHLDADNCMEVIVLEGKVKELKSFADSILTEKGVKYGKLVLLK